jgi:hypothetical protein
VTAEDDARDRVTAFVADFHGAWLRSGRVPAASERSDFAAWEADLAALVDRHFTPGSRTGAEGSLSGRPRHDPDTELPVSVDVDGDEATVLTRAEGVATPGHHTYRLVRAGEEWRIRRVVPTVGEPQQPPAASLPAGALVEVTVDRGYRHV